MADSTLLTGLYAAGVQAAAVVVLVYVVVVLMGTRLFSTPLTHPTENSPPGPRSASVNQRR